MLLLDNRITIMGSRIIIQQPVRNVYMNCLKTRRYGERITRIPTTNTSSSSSSSRCYTHRTFNTNNSSTTVEKIQLTESQKAALAQRRAYEYYRQKHGIDTTTLKQQSTTESLNDQNVKIASYAAAAVIGAIGATYAAVPLYKIFCQTTGFGGTTQRVKLSDWAESHDERQSTGRGKVSQALWDKLIDMSNVPREMLPGTTVNSTSHGRGGKTWTGKSCVSIVLSMHM